ncbi:uncharacterized protein LOC114530731 [Dendronephthya gigantea]|uniref:uncharacterized protein LOC114530731 n=1 Tax=Dendronephthya gigantea TaxID=151771 RepID=UPI001069D428|nr:uncharacterized protein LOC114530731 [Dendronephthya gigantea]
MESCLKYLPQKSYNTAGRVLLTIFVSIGVVVIGIAGIFESKATLQCDPNKRLASDLPTRKYIDTQCLLKYAQEFQPFLPLYVIFMLNFGFVLLLSIIYAYSVEHRVKIFVNTQSTTTNIGEEESQPLMSEISQAAADPTAHRKSAGRYVVFTWYVVHLIISRIIPLVVFAVVLLSSSNFPVQYQCQLQPKTTSSSRVNFTQRQNTNFSTVDCVYPTGSQNKNLAVAVVTIDFLVATTAFIELVYLLLSAWNDDNLLTDREFCCFYLLRKSKRIRKLIKVIRKSITEDTFHLYDDFNEEDWRRRKLEEMYINVIIQEGRERTYNYTTRFENRHETYKTHLKPADNVTILKNIEDLFKPKSKHDPLPKSILVVGRPGIGKTVLTKKMLRQWQVKSCKFWRDKIVILIRFRTFNEDEGITSLRKALHCSDGLNISEADFNTVYEYICLMPSKVVLIFDGLDELIVDEQYLNEKSNNALYNEETHILLIFKQLLKGQLLPGVTVITTSRPTAEHIYNSLPWERKAEILGFHEEQIREYVTKFCVTMKKVQKYGT